MRAATAARRSPPPTLTRSRPDTAAPRPKGDAAGPLWLAAAFLAGYAAGIPAGRCGGGLGGTLAEYYMDPASHASFAPVWGGLFAAAFLQLTLVFLSGFHLWGGVFLGILFAGRGLLLGACASAVYMAGGARSLTVYWLMTCLSGLGLLFTALWLGRDAWRTSAALARMALSGCRSVLSAGMRRLCRHYLVAVALCAVGSAPCAALAVFLAGVLL